MKVLVDGQLIEYKDEGKGKVVVLLHGWSSSLGSFDELAAYLSKSFRVIRLDFPGFGASPRPRTDWYIDDYATLTQAFLSKLGVKKIYALIGHSFGGRIIIKAIANNYLSPEKVILLGAAGIKPKVTAGKVAFKALAKVGKVVTAAPGLSNVRKKLRQKLYEAAGTTDYLNAHSMQQILVNTINEDLTPLIPSISQPTLMIWGENDTEVPLAFARHMHGLIKASHLVIVPGAGHYVFNDDFSAVKKEIEAFLQ